MDRRIRLNYWRACQTSPRPCQLRDAGPGTSSQFARLQGRTRLYYLRARSHCFLHRAKSSTDPARLWRWDRRNLLSTSRRQCGHRRKSRTNHSQKRASQQGLQPYMASAYLPQKTIHSPSHLRWRLKRQQSQHATHFSRLISSTLRKNTEEQTVSLSVLTRCSGLRLMAQVAVKCAVCVTVFRRVSHRDSSIITNAIP